MNKKFIVRLSVEERSQLEALVAKGKAAPRKLTRARILLKADCSSLGPAWSDQQISEALDLGAIAVHRVRRSFVEGGLDGALVRYKRPYDPLRPVVCMDETSKQLIGKGDPRWMRNRASRDAWTTSTSAKGWRISSCSSSHCGVGGGCGAPPKLEKLYPVLEYPRTSLIPAPDGLIENRVTAVVHV
jgi:Homeodomain-like domain